MDQKRRYWEQETLKYNWPHARMTLIAETIGRISPDASVLDLGAGKATLARLIGSSYRYLGLDIVGGTEEWPRVEACNFNHVEQFQLSGAPYDVVVISGLLEYLDEWSGFFRYVTTRWLAPQGTLLVSFTNAVSYQKGPFQKHPEWKNLFSLQEILKELAFLDLEVEHIYPLFWGNKRWGLPIIKTLAALAVRRRNFLLLDRLWVSQFLVVTHPGPKA